MCTGKTSAGMQKRWPMMAELSPSVLVFDSGIGGLSVLKELRILLPSMRYIYVADDAGFPYGAWDEADLLLRMTRLFSKLIDTYHPGMIVIGCNTASTLAIEKLRETFPNQIFVGTVPAVKPAAERTHSGLVSVLATPGTVKRQYTRDLIKQYASKCHVRLVGSEKLAALAETYMRHGYVDEQAVKAEAAPCFVEHGDQRTDIVVLACTHYPFLVNRLRKTAPWPVDWIDTSEAIARRALSLCAGPEFRARRPDEFDVAVFTSGQPAPEIIRLAGGFGLIVK